MRRRIIGAAIVGLVAIGAFFDWSARQLVGPQKNLATRRGKRDDD